jgi:hypothetical protein
METKEINNRYMTILSLVLALASGLACLNAIRVNRFNKELQELDESRSAAAVIHKSEDDAVAHPTVISRFQADVLGIYSKIIFGAGGSSYLLAGALYVRGFVPACMGAFGVATLFMTAGTIIIQENMMSVLRARHHMI